MQFQHADFEGEGFLHVGMQQALRLLQRLQIFQGQTRVDAAGDGFRPGNVLKSQQIFAGVECVQPDVAQPPLYARANPNDAGDIRPQCQQPIPPPISPANLFRRRRIFPTANGRSAILDSRTDFANFEAALEQTIASEQAFLFLGGQLPKIAQPFRLRGSEPSCAFAGKIQAQAARKNGLQDPCGSVDSKIKMDLAGGSSRVFKKAFAACRFKRSAPR